MSPRTKTVALLGLTQAICLAAGLWLQHQFLSAASPGVTASGDSPMALQLLVFVWTVGLQGGVAWLVLSRVHGEQDQQRNRSAEESLMQAREIVRTRDAVIFGLAKLAESRDPETGHHLERIALYSTKLATALRRHPRYRSLVTPAFVQSIGISSALHDVGKVGVEDAVLLKPGPLTAEERQRIQLHTQIGGDCIRQIQRRVGDPTFLEMALEITMHHHERWDGGGYPHGLAGVDIPLSARIVAIADVYDALSVRRVYKDAYSHDVCVEKIRRDAGRHFDPELVEVFLSIEAQFREIAQRFATIESGEPTVNREHAAAGESRSYVDVRISEQQERWLTEIADAVKQQPAVANRPGSRPPLPVNYEVLSSSPSESAVSTSV